MIGSFWAGQSWCRTTEKLSGADIKFAASGTLDKRFIIQVDLEEQPFAAKDKRPEIAFAVRVAGEVMHRDGAADRSMDRDRADRIIAGKHVVTGPRHDDLRVRVESLSDVVVELGNAIGSDVSLSEHRRAPHDRESGSASLPSSVGRRAAA